MKNTKSFLYETRKELKLTQKEMAKKLYLSYNTYLAYEHGTRKIPIDILILALQMIPSDINNKIIECLKRVYKKGE